MSRPRKQLEVDWNADDPRTPLEVAKEAIVREIKKKPPPEILTPLVNSLSKLLAVEAKIEEGSTYMEGFSETDDPPPTPPVKPP
jgi:hypothetical protein